MKRDDWLEVLIRLAVSPITEIDLGPLAPDPSGVDAANALTALEEDGTHDAANCGTPPSAQLWHIEAGIGACFGVRLRTPRLDIRPEAARLAAAAVERGVIPVILSHVDRSGFEQLGFRVERVHGETPAEREMQEAELCRFWDLSIVIDVEDVAQFS